MTRVVLDLDGRFAFFPEFLRLAADRADWFNASLTHELADQIEKQLDPPKPCEAILNVKGEHIGCDRDSGHSLPHGNVKHGAIWQGVGA